ncbi:thermonuclease family protein [Bacillus spizizenii]|nr:thermonuclease family protein [Bacillus spizizenii]MCY8890512.1 thermonuclease family protein [Bacillus spizizenii]MEC0841967.1 thermonuclease family protein [Bacillus spizizenii]
MTPIETDIQDNYIRKATICYVVDGDTADAIIDLGFGITTKQRIRFELIDAPERGEEGYQEAKDFVTDLILGKEVYLQTFKYKGGGWGRYMGWIYLPNEDGTLTNVSELVLQEGLAVVWKRK